MRKPCFSKEKFKINEIKFRKKPFQCSSILSGYIIWFLIFSLLACVSYWLPPLNTVTPITSDILSRYIPRFVTSQKNKNIGYLLYRCHFAPWMDGIIFFYNGTRI